MQKYILSIILGRIAGIMGGVLGTSGAFTILPGLLLLGIVKTQKKAAGTTLITILAPLSILAAYEYYKNGKLKHFKGRNILVLEFNEQDLITQMRRYLD